MTIRNLGFFLSFTLKLKKKKRKKNGSSQKVFFFLFVCMFGLMLNGIINFWPFDLNENFDLTSLKLDY